MTIVQVLCKVEQGSNEESKRSGEGKGEVVVEEVEGDSEVLDGTTDRMNVTAPLTVESKKFENLLYSLT